VEEVMSKKKEEIEKRRKRLSNMRNRHGSIGKPDFTEIEEGHPSGTGENEDPGAQIDSLFSNEGAGGKDNSDTFRIGQIIGYLTQETPEGEKIPGTDVNEESLEKLTRYLKGRQRTGSAPPWTKRALDFLDSSKEQEDGGYDSDKINRFVGFLKSRAKRSKRQQSKETPMKRTQKQEDPVSKKDPGIGVTNDPEGIMKGMGMKIARIKEEIASLEEMMAELQNKRFQKKSSKNAETARMKEKKKKVLEPEYIPPSSDDGKEADNWFGELLIK
jgi:hypothetical protein